MKASAQVWFAALLALNATLRADPAEMAAKLARLPAGTPVLEPAVPVTLAGTAGSLERVVVEGQPFTEALRVRTAERVEKPFKLQLNAAVGPAVRQGDILLAVFFARAVELPQGEYEARSEFVFESARGPFSRGNIVPLRIGAQWEKFYVPFTAAKDYPAGGAQVHFRVGYEPQVIEIAALSVTNYGTSVSARELPYTPANYRGREADAAWRAAAAERIEQHRKGDLTVLVRDAAGQPVPGAQVRVKMQRHAYGFGAAVDPKTLFREGPDADRFREVIVRDFNRVVIPNHLKWTYWKRDRETGLRALAWLREHGLDVRGHTLVWPAKKNMPASTLALFEQPEALRRAILDHIADIATATRGQLIEWDVLNEPVTKTDVQQVLGAEFFTECFHAARRADPAAKLYVNDYSILETGGYDTPHQDGYFATIRALLEARAPLEGIGMQSHFNENLTPIPRLAEILDRFATFGLPIEVTEFDVDTFDEQLQADYTRDFMTLVFSHPSTVGILTWGFWEKAHYIPNAALHRADWSLRPAGAVWYDLVFREWWTPEQQAVTDARGEIHLRGFHGDYAIEVLGAAHTARLRGAQSRVEITLPNPEPPASR